MYLRYLIVAFLAVFSSVGEAKFKVTVLTTEAPDVKPVVERQVAPSINNVQRAGVETKSAQPPAGVASNERGVNLRPDVADQVVVSSPRERRLANEAVMQQQAQLDSPVTASQNTDNENRYEQLQRIKRDQVAEGFGSKASEPKIESLVSSEPLKPLLELKKNESFEDTLTRWSNDNNYQLIFNLGVWDRIRGLKMTVDYMFTTELKSSVAEYLELLNKTPQLSSNNVSLVSCFYENSYIQIVVDENNCEVK